jgi:hypothetical protein
MGHALIAGIWPSDDDDAYGPSDEAAMGQTRMSSAMEERVRANFGRIWPVHVSSLTRFLIECRHTFDGDLDMLLVLAVIGDRTFSHRRANPALDFDAFQSREKEQTPPEDINVRSIADFSGIPRETVRRKVAQLLEKGWVTRNDDGFITASRQANTELEPLTRTSIRYIARMMALVDELNREGSGSGGGS